jgi:hypothetical protein
MIEVITNELKVLFGSALASQNLMKLMKHIIRSFKKIVKL